jgi:ABC-2 type transport system ATP-binding protein
MGYTPSAHTRQFFEQIYYITDEVELPAMSLEGYIGTYAKFRPGFSREQMQSYLERMNFTFGVKLNKLSLGNRKKFIIAFALACNTPLLLMDEPTNGLDIPSKALFRKVILQHSTDANENSTDAINRVPTIIISTHQVKDVENLIDPIVILDHDEVLLNATFEEISQRLYFEYGAEKSDEALYSEMMPGGYINVLPNTFNMESKVNVEALFNAVRCNKKKIREIFVKVEN